MAILEDCANHNGELLKTRAAFIDASANRFLAFGSWLKPVNRLVFVVFAMRANRAVFPKHGLKVLARRLIFGESVNDLNKRQIL